MLGRGKAQPLRSGLSVQGLSRTESRREQYLIGEYFRSDFAWRPGMTVFDIGANVGMFSLELLRRCDGDARIFAFEPAPSSFEMLERNIRESFGNAPVSVRRVAVSDRRGQATLYHRPRLSVLSSLRPEPIIDGPSAVDAILKEPPSDYPQRLSAPVRRILRPVISPLLRLFCWWLAVKVVEVPCEVTTVSDVIRESGVERVDLLKVDVEGAELDVLRGITDEDWPKIQAIAAEVHDIDGRAETIRALLTSAGFDRVDITQEWPFEGTSVYMLDARRANGVHSR